MGNVKKGSLTGISIYFTFMFLLGASILFLEEKLIAPIFHIPQTVCTFSLLIYVMFIFFWNGTSLLKPEDQQLLFNNQNKDSPGK